MSSELENSGIRVTVGDCSVIERRQWCPPYQTGNTVHWHAKHYEHNEDGCTAPAVCGNGSVPLSHLGNVVLRIGIHTYSGSIISVEVTLLLLPPFAVGAILKRKNLLLEEQILSFKNRPHFRRELAFTEKQTKIHQSLDKIIFGKNIGNIY